MDLSILPYASAFEGALRGMWRSYQEFYRVTDIDEATNRAHVSHILENPALGRIHLALAEGQAIGFSTLYFTFASTRACPVAILNDLFVVPERRGAGTGRRLLEHALGFAQREGIRFVRWSTEASNTSAQRLYQRYAQPTSWLMYSVDVSREPRGAV